MVAERRSRALYPTPDRSRVWYPTPGQGSIPYSEPGFDTLFRTRFRCSTPIQWLNYYSGAGFETLLRNREVFWWKIRYSLEQGSILSGAKFCTLWGKVRPSSKQGAILLSGARFDPWNQSNVRTSVSEFSSISTRHGFNTHWRRIQ